MAQDRTVDQWQARQADLPQEAQPEQADLPARLERLPVGHPSSPYRDDGSRKPRPPDLANYELPLPQCRLEHHDRWRDWLQSVSPT